MTDKPLTKVECPKCYGTGKIIDSLNIFRDGAKSVASYKTCNLCNGTGKVDEEVKDE